MKMTVERELRVEDVFSGEIISANSGEVQEENSEIDPCLARTYARVYGYVLTKGEDGILISFDFGFEDIGDAINACKAAALDSLYHVFVEENVWSRSMKAFEELADHYTAEIKRALYELRTSGATADEIWERLDKIRDEYAAEYEKLCFSMLKKEYLKF